MPAHAHSAEHHEGGADHGHAANNALRFNNGGVLGIANAFGNLLKGVTYDAANETFGGGHGAHGAEHGAHGTDHVSNDHAHAAHATPAAHGADHAAPTVDSHGHPIAAAAAAVAGHVLHSDHDDHDASLVDRGIHFLAHAGHYSAALPWLGKALKFAKDKLFPEIHEIPTDEDHLGDQILHKLKKSKKPDAHGHISLDHHALEGFLKGIDIANLERKLRMFTDKKRFQNALTRSAGQEELKKEIANLLDLSGEADRDEVLRTLKMMAGLLGAKLEEEKKQVMKADGTPEKDANNNDVMIGTGVYKVVAQPNHHVDQRVKDQLHALEHIIEHAANWLTEDALKAIYTGEVTTQFEIDYDNLGDVLFEKVNDGNRSKFLKSFKKRSFDNAFGLLVKESEMKDALRHDPEHLKSQIYKLFDCAGNVDEAELKERVEAYFGSSSAKGILGEETDYDEAGKKKYKEMKKAFEDILSNISRTKALETLFHSTTPVNLGEFGKALERVQDEGDLTKFLKGFNPHHFKKTFRFLLDGDRIDKIVQGDEAQRRGVQTQLLTLLGYDGGPLDEAEVVAVIDGFMATLTRLEPAIDASLKGTDKPYDQLMQVLTDVKTVLNTKNRVKKIFEGAELDASPDYGALGKQILDEIGKDKKKQIPFLKNLNVALYTATKVNMLSSSTIDILMSDPAGKDKIKEAIANLFGVDSKDRIYTHDIETRIEAMKAALQNSKLAYDPEAHENYKAFEQLLNKVKKNLTEARLNKVYA